jgi:glutamine amidotransferase
VKGAVVRFRISKKSALKVPHMGWNTLQRGSASRTPVIRGVSEVSYFYFVHSYYPQPKDSSVVATHTVYGHPFCSSVAQGRLFACQFHPEKSGDQGQRLLRNFVSEVPLC